MNETLERNIAEWELRSAANSMEKGKAPRHDVIPIEFFQWLWPAIGKGSHQMFIRSLGSEKLYTNISLILKECDVKDLNQWKPITFFWVVYKIYA